jgi:hypothetical protein
MFFSANTSAKQAEAMAKEMRRRQDLMKQHKAQKEAKRKQALKDSGVRPCLKGTTWSDSARSLITAATAKTSSVRSSTLDESDRTTLSEAADQTCSSTDDSSSRNRKKVTFSDLEILEFTMQMGDSDWCPGAPLSMSNDMQRRTVLPVDVFEMYKPKHQKRDFRLLPVERTHMYVRENTRNLFFVLVHGFEL